MAEERWICITAHGEASIAPDLAVVSLAVSGNGADLGATRDDVNTRASAVLGRLGDLGLDPADIDAPDVGIHPEYDYRRGQRLVGYRVTRQMTVRVRELDRLGELLDAVVAAGANEVGGAQMTASDPTAAEHAALQSAVAAARAKAEVLAAAAGVTLGSVARIEEEAGPSAGPMPRFRAMAALAESAEVPTEVATGDLTVTRTIRAWFDLG